mmetsp:Transcript_7818/g.48473  ORF Transcript_7818/g.48473 Transcript_7818/m.48473 type:complete len:220 (+) Transcript_7818:1249-1908(+)
MCVTQVTAIVLVLCVFGIARRVINEDSASLSVAAVLLAHMRKSLKPLISHSHFDSCQILCVQTTTRGLASSKSLSSTGPIERRVLLLFHGRRNEDACLAYFNGILSKASTRLCASISITTRSIPHALSFSNQRVATELVRTPLMLASPSAYRCNSSATLDFTVPDSSRTSSFRRRWSWGSSLKIKRLVMYGYAADTILKSLSTDRAIPSSIPSDLTSSE